MEDYQLRVVEEKKELDLKLEALDNFLTSEHFTTKVSSIQQDLLYLQHQWMSNYSKVLEMRIKDFIQQNESKELDK